MDLTKTSRAPLGTANQMNTYQAHLAIVGVLILPALQSASRVPRRKAEITPSFAPLVRQASPNVESMYLRRVVQRQGRRFPEIRSLNRTFAISERRHLASRPRWDQG